MNCSTVTDYITEYLNETGIDKECVRYEKMDHYN